MAEQGAEQRQQAEAAAKERLLLWEKVKIRELVERCGSRLYAGHEFIPRPEPQRLQTGWKPPRALRSLGEHEREQVRRRLHISVRGEAELPPPIQTFQEMRFPEPLLQALEARGITRPTPIQVQALPLVLSGTDTVGVAPPASGKTLVFALPLVMLAQQEERRMPLMRGEGPLGLVLCSSREAAWRSWDVVQELAFALARAGHPPLRCMLCSDAVDFRSQLAELGSMNGVHIAVATPGGLQALLATKKMNLDNCKLLALDEADRLMALGFGYELWEMMGQLKGQRQVVLVSATMPRKVGSFVALAKPHALVVAGTATSFIDEKQMETALLDLNGTCRGCKTG